MIGDEETALCHASRQSGRNSLTPPDAAAIINPLESDSLEPPVFSAAMDPTVSEHAEKPTSQESLGLLSRRSADDQQFPWNSKSQRKRKIKRAVVIHPNPPNL